VFVCLAFFCLLSGYVCFRDFTFLPLSLTLARRKDFAERSRGHYECIEQHALILNSYKTCCASGRRSLPVWCKICLRGSGGSIDFSRTTQHCH